MRQAITKPLSYNGFFGGVRARLLEFQKSIPRKLFPGSNILRCKFCERCELSALELERSRWHQQSESKKPTRSQNKWPCHRLGEFQANMAAGMLKVGNAGWGNLKGTGIGNRCFERLRLHSKIERLYASIPEKTENDLLLASFAFFLQPHQVRWGQFGSIPPCFPIAPAKFRIRQDDWRCGDPIS